MSVMQSCYFTCHILRHMMHKITLQSSKILHRCHCERRIPALVHAAFSTSARRENLSQFFDDKENWGEETIKCGRPWHLDELRIKSNEDLHKLWYVLLKERNMLMTMEAEYTRQCELFPSPERVDKVEESMENILAIVDERNEAFSMLETGKSNKPEKRVVRNFLGLKYHRTPKEYAIPSFMNKFYRLTHAPYRSSMNMYINLYKEQKRRERMRELRREQKNMKMLEKKFPHLRESEKE
ncbi:39S ribosomal protein L47, mitochondrial-like [Gigantopelta aegis]|uniref:39S ribosomal protein L47, mitochondrial-like n=1 Tax=Gigantopelta aegis TaxID=1735272 RepID=UPI001B888063|nr:39S ribosomal protein L47, mitochondrial-like [Gigantopelta aegis]